MLFCISTSNIQVLFDELCLDEKCKKKLSKTQVQRQKSTSEAVVSLIIHSISSVDVFTCGVCVCVCVCSAHSVERPSSIACIGVGISTGMLVSIDSHHVLVIVIIVNRLLAL